MRKVFIIGLAVLYVLSVEAIPDKRKSGGSSSTASTRGSKDQAAGSTGNPTTGTASGSSATRQEQQNPTGSVMGHSVRHQGDGPPAGYPGTAGQQSPFPVMQQPAAGPGLGGLILEGAVGGAAAGVAAAGTTLAVEGIANAIKGDDNKEEKKEKEQAHAAAPAPVAPASAAHNSTTTTPSAAAEVVDAKSIEDKLRSEIKACIKAAGENIDSINKCVASAA
jgi:hypothetical protein